MRKIGSGWQVFVYEYNQHTVYKKVKTPFYTILKIIADMPLMIFRPATLLSWACSMRSTQLDSLNYLKTKTSIWNEVGRPVIEQNGNYYQDKIIPLGKFIKDKDSEASKKIIDEAIALCFKLFKEGFIDKSFNILINFGVLDGRVVLSDLGELFHGPKMFDQIKKRPWVKPCVLRFIFMEHRDYFIKEMNKRFIKEIK